MASNKRLVSKRFCIRDNAFASTAPYVVWMVLPIVASSLRWKWQSLLDGPARTFARQRQFRFDRARHEVGVNRVVAEPLYMTRHVWAEVGEIGLLDGVPLANQFTNGSGHLDHVPVDQ